MPTPTIHNGVEEMLPKLFFIFPLQTQSGRGFTMAAKLGWGQKQRKRTLATRHTLLSYHLGYTAATDGSPPPLRVAQRSRAGVLLLLYY